MKTLNLLVICVAVFFPPTFSQATLGASVHSAAKNLSAVNASQKVGANEKYSTYEYEQNGNTVKEFSSAEGVVFAVSWRGISKPDLHALFGSYFNEYTDAFGKVPKQYGMKSLSMKTTQMVIHRGGRMRDQSGFVYVPSLVPEGINVEDLK